MLVSTLLGALLAVTPAHAEPPSLEAGLALGPQLTDRAAPIAGAFEVVPRGTWWFDERGALDLSLGLGIGSDRQIERTYLSFSPRVDLVARLLVDTPVEPLITLGVGAMAYGADDAVERVRFPAKSLEPLLAMGVGARIPLGRLVARTDLGLVVSHLFPGYPGATYAHAQWTLGVALWLGELDGDGDGVADSVDECRDEPEDVDEFEDTDGCPDLDNDGDGLTDRLDACPDEAEDVDEYEDADGCLDEDNDGDGVLDGLDVCPLEAGDPDVQGCPDSDGDAVADFEDDCPDLAGMPARLGCPDLDGDEVLDDDDECDDLIGVAESFGCPDTDRDRVPDYRDECPEVQASAEGSAQFSTGCLDPVLVTATSIFPTDGLAFPSGSDRLDAAARTTLDQVAALLARYPELELVEVGVHTSGSGDAEAEKALSIRRAKAIVDYLIAAEIAEKRLVPMGYGQTQPLTDSGVEAFRAVNERVILTLLVQRVPDLALTPEAEVPE